MYKNRYLDDLECPYCGFQPVEVGGESPWQIFGCPECHRKFMVDPKYLAFIFVGGNPVIVKHPDHETVDTPP